MWWHVPSEELAVVSAQGANLAHMTRLSTLSMALGRWSLRDTDRHHCNYRPLMLDAYPASLRRIVVTFDEAFAIHVQSYRAAPPDMQISFRATSCTEKSLLVLTDAAGLLTGQHIEIGVHRLEVQTRAEAQISRPSVSCICKQRIFCPWDVTV